MIRFCLLTKNKIIVSDLPFEKLHEKIGLQYEILNTIKDKEYVDVIKQRLLRSYPEAKFEEYFIKIRLPKSPEHRERLRQSKLGKPRPEWVRKKISLAKKGVSQFAGKKHTEETKRIMAIKKLGNQHVKDTIWAHDPRGREEQRVRDLKQMKIGFSKGRDYYSIEPLICAFRLYRTNKIKNTTNIF